MEAIEIKIPSKIGEGSFFSNGAPCCAVGHLLQQLDRRHPLNCGDIPTNWPNKMDCQNDISEFVIMEVATLFSDEFGYNEENVYLDFNALIRDNDRADTMKERKDLLKQFVSTYSKALKLVKE